MGPVEKKTVIYNGSKSHCQAIITLIMRVKCWRKAGKISPSQRLPRGGALGHSLGKLSLAVGNVSQENVHHFTANSHSALPQMAK